MNEKINLEQAQKIKELMHKIDEKIYIEREVEIRDRLNDILEEINKKLFANLVKNTTKIPYNKQLTNHIPILKPSGLYILYEKRKYSKKMDYYELFYFFNENNEENFKEMAKYIKDEEKRRLFLDICLKIHDFLTKNKINLYTEKRIRAERITIMKMKAENTANNKLIFFSEEENEFKEIDKNNIEILADIGEGNVILLAIDRSTNKQMLKFNLFEYERFIDKFNFNLFLRQIDTNDFIKILEKINDALETRFKKIEEEKQNLPSKRLRKMIYDNYGYLLTAEAL